MKLMIEKNVGKNVQFGKSYTDLFKLTYDKEGRLLYGKERSDVITRELRLCGYFCIVTSEKMTASAALIQYKGRDISEKLFKADKSFLGARSMRVQSEEALSAKIFVEFVSLIVRNRIYNLLKETMLKMESNPNYMTVPASLRELEKIEMVRRNNGDYKLDHAVTKKQKIILGSFGLEESDIRKTAEEINTMLINNQSLMSELTEEENDDGEE
jgi:transposase